MDGHGIIIPRRSFSTAPMPVGVRVWAESLKMKPRAVLFQAASTGHGSSVEGAASTPMMTRSIKIEAIGDFQLGKIKPRIRLLGHWLERAGFKPGHRVEVRWDQPGTLTLCFVNQPQASALPDDAGPGRGGSPVLMGEDQAQPKNVGNSQPEGKP